jgi:predicted RecA/RadA family phage recombinase
MSNWWTSSEEDVEQDKGVESFRGDGKSVKVEVSQEILKGDPVYAEGFTGIALGYAGSGEEVAIEVARREHEITVGAGVTANKGDILYIDSSSTITNTDTDEPFMKVTVAKDANNVVRGILIGIHD